MSESNETDPKLEEFLNKMGWGATMGERLEAIENVVTHIYRRLAALDGKTPSKEVEQPVKLENPALAGLREKLEIARKARNRSEDLADYGASISSEKH